MQKENDENNWTVCSAVRLQSRIDCIDFVITNADSANGPWVFIDSLIDFWSISCDGAEAYTPVLLTKCIKTYVCDCWTSLPVIRRHGWNERILLCCICFCFLHQRKWSAQPAIVMKAFFDIYLRQQTCCLFERQWHSCRLSNTWCFFNFSPCCADVFSILLKSGKEILQEEDSLLIWFAGRQIPALWFRCSASAFDELGLRLNNQLFRQDCSWSHSSGQVSSSTVTFEQHACIDKKNL